jgi:hypothetical protein
MPRRPDRRNAALYARLRDEQADREQAAVRVAEIERELGREVTLIPPEARVDGWWGAKCGNRTVAAETAAEALSLLRRENLLRREKVEAANDR